MTDPKQFRAKIRGRVQGVGFRHTTMQTASRLGCTGWVRNNRDGTVTCVAQGTEDKLEELISFLQDGPRNARVEDIAVTWEAPTETFDVFRIRT